MLSERNPEHSEQISGIGTELFHFFNQRCALQTSPEIVHFSFSPMDRISQSLSDDNPLLSTGIIGRA
jgi:hypothetical protein